MLNSFYTIVNLVKEVNTDIVNTFIGPIFSHAKNSITICFYLTNEEQSLVVNAHQNRQLCYVEKNVKIPQSNIVTLFDEIENDQILKVELVSNERAIQLKLNSNKSLIITLFGNLPNVYLLSDDQILKSFKQSTKWQGKQIHDLFPKFNSPLKSNSIEDEIKNRFPKFSNQDRKRILSLNKIDFGDSDSAITLFCAIESQILSSPTPRLLEDYSFSLINEKYLPINTMYNYDSINEGLKRVWSILRNEYNLAHEKKKWETILQKRISYLNGLIQQSKQIDKTLEKIQKWQNYGHLLMAQPNPNQKLKEILVHDFYNENQRIKIPLKENLTLIENANRYYNRSNGAEQSLDLLQAQSEKAKVEYESLNPIYEELKTIVRFHVFKKWMKSHKTLLDAFKSQKIESESGLDGVIHLSYSGYDIWVGKHATANDLILQKSHKEDIWMHARNVGGSHVIIRMNKKKTDLDTAFLEKIASIAAWHSQAKGSSLVPVQIARRKHIRKPKNVELGKVIVSKEQVLMVEPKRSL